MNEHLNLLVSPSDVAQMCRVSKTTVYRWRRESSTFPKPAVEKHGFTRFRYYEILEWIEKYLLGGGEQGEEAG